MLRRLLLVASFLCSAPALAEPVSVARASVDAMARGDWTAARKAFGPKLAAALDEAELAKGWTTKRGDGGAVRGIEEAHIDGERVVVRVTLAKGSMDVWLTVKDDVVTGLHIDHAWQAPAYVDATKFDERPVLVKDLPGTLAVPKGAGPFPALIMVHGSGPNDRDESTPGGAKPFRDLAQGLATRGIIVLRYEKRTYGHWAALGLPMDAVTVKEEYTDDVAAAAATLRATKEVDGKRIYVLGHSMGGFMMPRFLASDPALAGGISLAGLSRPLADALLPQYAYIFKVQHDSFATFKLDVLKGQVARAKDPTLSAKVPASALPLGLPAGYWISMRGYDPPSVARSLPQPVLILQGERDYNVTPEDDFALWKQKLAGKANAKAILYPKLNHDFFAGEGPIAPEEYEKRAGHVEGKVVNDIRAFVR